MDEPPLGRANAVARGERYLEAGRPSFAIEAALEALGEDPHDDDAHGLFVHALVQDDQVDRALEAAEAWRSISPELAECRSLIGAILTDAGRHREAEAEILAALRLEPTWPYPFVAYAGLLFKTGHLEKAERVARKALELDPESEDAHQILSRILAFGSDGKAALQHGRQSVTLSPDEDDSHRSLGTAYLLGGRPFAARRHLREALRLNPDDSDLEEAFLEADRCCRWIYLPMYYWSLLLKKIPGQQFTLWVLVALSWVLIPHSEEKPSWPLLIIVGSYALFCIYTWFAGPLSRAWIRLLPPR